MTRRLPLRNQHGLIVDWALVDADDYERLKGFRWYRQSQGYAARSEYLGNYRSRVVLMHRHIMGLAAGDRRVTDHKNGNLLDNRRSNLRVVQGAGDNQQNRRRGNRGSSSQFRGVAWEPDRNKWCARVMLDRRTVYRERFDTEQEAAAAAAAFRAQHMPYSQEAKRG